MSFNRQYFTLFLFTFIICSCDENKHIKSYRLPKTNFNVSKNEVPKDIPKNVKGIVEKIILYDNCSCLLKL